MGDWVFGCGQWACRASGEAGDGGDGGGHVGFGCTEPFFGFFLGFFLEGYLVGGGEGEGREEEREEESDAHTGGQNRRFGGRAIASQMVLKRLMLATSSHFSD